MGRGGKAKAIEGARAAGVLALLAGRGGPMTAYELLAALAKDGVRAPTVVYRALRTLERNGQVHRIDSLNAWVAAVEQGRTGRPVIAICEDCGSVDMLPGADAATSLAGIAQAAGFSATTASIELRGLCGTCREQSQ